MDTGGAPSGVCGEMVPFSTLGGASPIAPTDSEGVWWGGCVRRSGWGEGMVKKYVSRRDVVQFLSENCGQFAKCCKAL